MFVKNWNCRLFGTSIKKESGFFREKKISKKMLDEKCFNFGLWRRKRSNVNLNRSSPPRLARHFCQRAILYRRFGVRMAVWKSERALLRRRSFFLARARCSFGRRNERRRGFEKNFDFHSDRLRLSTLKDIKIVNKEKKEIWNSC